MKNSKMAVPPKTGLFALEGVEYEEITPSTTTANSHQFDDTDTH